MFRTGSLSFVGAMFLVGATLWAAPGVAAEIEGFLCKTSGYELVTTPGKFYGEAVCGATPAIEAIMRWSAYDGINMTKIMEGKPEFIAKATKFWVSGEMKADVLVADKVINRANPGLDGTSLALCYAFLDKLSGHSLHSIMSGRPAGYGAAWLLFYSEDLLAKALVAAKAVTAANGSLETAKTTFLETVIKLSTKDRAKVLRTLRDCDRFDDAMKAALGIQ